MNVFSLNHSVTHNLSLVPLLLTLTDILFRLLLLLLSMQ